MNNSTVGHGKAALREWGLLERASTRQILPEQAAAAFALPWKNRKEKMD